LHLQCWVRGADPEKPFTVEIPTKATVNDLKKAIRNEKLVEFHDVDANDLDLYKISVNGEAKFREHLGALGSGRLVQWNELVQSVFDDVPFAQSARVVVELPDKSKQCYGSVDRNLPGSGCCMAARRPAAIPSDVHPQLQYIQAWARNPPKSPSQQGEASSFKALQSTGLRIEWT